MFIFAQINMNLSFFGWYPGLPMCLIIMEMYNWYPDLPMLDIQTNISIV